MPIGGPHSTVKGVWLRLGPRTLTPFPPFAAQPLFLRFPSAEEEFPPHAVEAAVAIGRIDLRPSHVVGGFHLLYVSPAFFSMRLFLLTEPNHRLPGRKRFLDREPSKAGEILIQP